MSREGYTILENRRPTPDHGLADLVVEDLDGPDHGLADLVVEDLDGPDLAGLL